MLIAQISDCHIVAPGHKLFGQLDPAACLRRAVTVISTLPVKPDLVLATGDLTANGFADEYKVFVEAVADLPCPVLPLVGNHDDRDHLINAFRLGTRFSLLPGFVQYAWDADNLRILAMDTVETGQVGGCVCPKRLGWLQDQLAAADRPILIAMHHPPFDVGIGWLDASNSWGEEIHQEIAQNSSIARIVCGHAHRAMTMSWAGSTAIVAPSTAHQVFPDLRPEAPHRFTREAPGFVLHQMSPGPPKSFFVSTAGALDFL